MPGLLEMLGLSGLQDYAPNDPGPYRIPQGGLLAPAMQGYGGLLSPRLGEGRSVATPAAEDDGGYGFQPAQTAASGSPMQLPSAMPQATPASSPSGGGFDLGKAIGGIYGAGGPGDGLIALGTGLLSKRGLGAGLAAGTDNMQRQALVNAQTGLVQQKQQQAAANLQGRMGYLQQLNPKMTPEALAATASNDTLFNETVKRASPNETFENVLGSDGTVIGQRNKLTGKVESYPQEKDDRTNDMKNYEAAKAGGFTGTFPEYQKSSKGPLVDLGNKGNEAVIKNIADSIDASKSKAEGAYSTLGAIQRQRQALDNGMMTGWGADWQAQGRAALAKLLGIDDATVANTQAFQAAAKAKGAELAKTISNAGHTTNADLDIGQAIAGGDIGKMEKAIRSTIDAQEVIAKDQIARHNANVGKFQKIIGGQADPSSFYTMSEPAPNMFPNTLAPQQPAAPAAASGAKPPVPMKGMTRGGYRFMGGDPSSPDSWQKL